jgi:NADH:ubiquinone oxidoreductase subunit E
VDNADRAKSDKVFVFICKGDACTKKGNPERLRVHLKQMAREFPASSLKVSYVSCLGLCGEGPNILVCRGGDTFSHCTQASAGAVEQTVREALEHAP